MPKTHKRKQPSAPPGALFSTPTSYRWAEYRRLTFIFDQNILSRLDTPPGEGYGLGDLLQTLRDPAEPRETVVLLPAVAEANYRRAGGADAVLRKYRSYFDPHFGAFGIDEIGAFSFGREQSLSQNLFQISFRVLVNYWLLSTARNALEGRRKKADRETVLNRFFDAVSNAGCYPKSKFPLLAVATTLAGNVPGANALNVRDASVESLMNGSWDLLYWHSNAQLSLDSTYTGCVSRFFSYDPDAVGLFLRMEHDGDSVRLVYDADTPEDTFRDVIDRGTERVLRAPLDGEELIERIHGVLPSGYHCREYERARELFKTSLALCRSETVRDNVVVLKRPSLK